MITIFFFILSIYVGYRLSLFVSHPIKKKSRMPHLRLKNVEILPNLRFHYGERTYHFHHWLYLSLIMIASFIIYENAQQFLVLKGAAFGGIIQGLRYPDRFRIRHPRHTV